MPHPHTHHLLGLRAAAKGWQIAELARQHGRVLVVCSSTKEAEELQDDLAFFIGSQAVQHYPAWDLPPFQPATPLIDISAQRIAVLHTILQSTASSDAPQVILAPLESLLQRVVPREFIDSLSLLLAPGSKLDREILIRTLTLGGYSRKPTVEEVGDFALRGSVIDLFSPKHPLPIRIDLRGDSVERLRTFSADSQRSIGVIEQCWITPVSELVPFYGHQSFCELIPALVDNIEKRALALEVPPRESEQIIASFRHGLMLPGLELYQFIGPQIFPTFFDLLSEQFVTVVIDQIAIESALDHRWERIAERANLAAAAHSLFPNPENLYVPAVTLLAQLAASTNYSFDSIALLGSELEESNIKRFKTQTNVELTSQLKTGVGSGDAFKPLQQFVAKLRQDNYRVAFVAGTKPRAKRLQRILLAMGLDAPILCNDKVGLSENFAADESAAVNQWLQSSVDSARALPLVILPGRITAGVQIEEARIALISESEVFPDRSRSQHRVGERKLKRLLNSISLLKNGDYIVHLDYGIGIYQGLVQLEVEGAESDFIQLEYADSKLYLPIQHIGKIQKFVAGEGSQPNIDKLSSSRWAKTKLKIQQSVLSIAGDLIKLYAARKELKGWRFEPVGAEDERFADGFPYTETPDQLAAINATLEDMASDKPMDRLICGDVGFGKTEVAIRAAFKCVQHTRQAAILAPTTVLVEQHFRSFKDRFAEYPIKIGAVSRFYNAQQNRETLAKLASGELDIVVGTHKLLQRDVEFRDLGLLVIDEEHRFGVKQKERLKQLKRQVDVVTLTATPIPRTLHMALLGIRDISVIATPPVDRRRIRTHVACTNEGLIRDSIMREIERGGQVFYLHNRIQGIEITTHELQTLVPEARIRFAHGQMSEGQLEPLMRDFVNHQFDVLVSTTIIESGIDIPNANTIIIERADMLGLAQLYQLRGRVGRSDRQAYAYLLIPSTGKLTRDAHQRLVALQSLDELGVGFNLAMQDLEIRGVGNLLGKEQHGNVSAIGFDLYTKILQEAVMNIRGDEIAIEEYADPEVKLGIPALIPEFYVPDISERLILYQRLAAIKDPSDVDALRDEMEDRFGPVSEPVYNLIEVMRIRALLKHFGVATAEFTSGTLSLSFLRSAPLDIHAIVKLAKEHPKKYRFSKNLTLHITKSIQYIEDPAPLYLELQKLLGKLHSGNPNRVESLTADQNEPRHG